MGHFYMSQSDKGGLVFGGDIDGYNSYGRAEHADRRTCHGGGVALIPGVAHPKFLRSWGGIMDMFDGWFADDRKTRSQNLLLNGGWCYGGFRATPASGWCFAHPTATGQTHRLAAPFRASAPAAPSMSAGAGAQPNLH